MPGRMKPFKMFPSIMLDCVILVCPLLLLHNSPNVSGCTEPLLLTPYLQQGEITTARELSLVVDEEGVIPRSHAGFITVDQISGNHLFFWFFPTLNSNPSAPLLIWLNGGPGESSMVGLLYENGPIQLGESNSGEAIYTSRNNSWVNKFCMLYIDNPVGTGYSYSDNLDKGKRSTQDGITRDLYEFIQQFYQIFPEFLLRDLYIGGQSYAGKYVPALALSIHQQNYFCETYVPLKGIYLGAPLIDPSVQLLELFQLYYQLGYISNKQFIEFKKNMIEIFPRLEGKEIFSYMSLLFGYTSSNFHKFEYINETKIDGVMTSGKVRSLLHVGNTEFALRNYPVHFDVIEHDLKVSSVNKLTELMKHYKVLIYNGDLDGIISAPGLEAIIQSMRWSFRTAYYTSKRVAWAGKDGTLKGFYDRVSSFCRVVVRLAGHRTAIDQPDNTLEMIDRFVTNGCVR